MHITHDLSTYFSSPEAENESSVSVGDNELLYGSVENVFCCPLDYWPDDENSLYHPALLTPPPMLEPGSSFSEPYLSEVALINWRLNCEQLSPVKGLSVDTYRNSTDTLNTENSTIEDDFNFVL